MVLLAAGRRARDTVSGGGAHRLTARFRGRTVAEWAIRQALAAGVGPVSVVVGTVDVPVPAGAGVRVVPNPEGDPGLATSLQVAVEIARRAGHEAVVIGLADQPLVEPEAWRLVARSRSPIAVATYRGHRGHPVRLAAPVWPLLPTSGDEGARSVMRRHPELVAEVPCPGDAADVDTVQDLSRFEPDAPTEPDGPSLPKGQAGRGE